MSPTPFSQRALALGFILATFGCQPGVREDRTITFDSEGRAAFQHGQNGVFVTDPKTGAPKQIYESKPGDIAVSPPAWEPGGKRMVFTVARALDARVLGPLGDAPADGRRYPEAPVRYTCWLHDPTANDAPQKLFEVGAGHVGYVAAGVAVCWHPNGKRLDFVEQTGDRRHSVRTFDVSSGAIADVLLPVSENVALGSAPNRAARYALLGGAGSESGLWIEGADGVWWRVPASEPPTSHLEVLRQRLPQWSRGGTKLAFTDGTQLRVCDVAKRAAETWFTAKQKQPEPPALFPLPLGAPHWHPDGTRIGILNGTQLGLVDSTGWQKALTEAPVVAFAGWNATGTRMAYVTREPLPYSAGALWATLLVPNAHARTAVRVADADGANEKVLVSGLRATFPHWAPGEAKFSVWLTVEPPYRLATIDRIGMPPGDPAALVDPETGKLDWLPVNGTEHAQIGHVELRAGRIEAALKRFDDAATGLGADATADWMVFRAIALQKAGRTGAVNEAWKRFAPAPVPPPQPGAGVGAELIASASALTVRHRFIAEAFVSLEMANEGIEYFRSQIAAPGSDADRLSAALALSQLLLLTDRKAEYAECATNHLLPLADKALPSAGTGRQSMNTTVAWALLPLAADEFVAALPEAVVRNVSQKVTAPTGAEDIHFVCLLVRRACGRQLKADALTEVARAKIESHPARARWNLDNDKVDTELLTRVQAAVLMREMIREHFGADAEPMLRIAEPVGPVFRGVR